MKLGLITPFDVLKDKQFFSGVGHELYCALNKRVEIVPLTVPIRKPPRFARLQMGIRRSLNGKRYNMNLYPQTVRKNAGIGRKLAEAAGVDVALVMGQAGLAFWDAAVPAAFFSDTLFGAKFDVYGDWKLQQMDPLQLQQLQDMGQRAVDNAVVVFLTNNYSFERAADFGTVIPQEKRVVTYIGPNFSAPDKLLSPPPAPPLRLLWVGGRWKRKGGDDCVAVADALVAAGVPVELHIVGKMPPDISRPYLTFHGYLRKGNPSEYQQLGHLYQTCHFLILPSRGDMGPVALADAAAMGLPAVATNVGGIPDFFPNGEAILIPPEQFRTRAPLVIQEVMASGEMATMRYKVRQRYEEALNWDTVADKIVSRLEIASAGS